MKGLRKDVWGGTVAFPEGTGRCVPRGPVTCLPSLSPGETQMHVLECSEQQVRSSKRTNNESEQAGEGIHEMWYFNRVNTVQSQT